MPTRQRLKQIYLYLWYELRHLQLLIASRDFGKKLHESEFEETLNLWKGNCWDELFFYHLYNSRYLDANQINQLKKRQKPNVILDNNVQENVYQLLLHALDMLYDNDIVDIMYEAGSEKDYVSFTSKVITSIFDVYFSQFQNKNAFIYEEAASC